MKRSLFLAFLLIAALGAYVRADDQPAAPAKKHKIVFQVNYDGEDRFDDVVTNVENTQKAFGKDNVQIVVVAHSNGAGLVLKGNDTRTKRIEAATAAGAQFDLCTFTAKSRHIQDEQIIPGVVKVQGGIPEVVRLQEQGYTYIKLN